MLCRETVFRKEGLMPRRDALIDDPRYLQVRHRVPLTIDPRALRPLPPALWGMSCTWCDKAQAKWEYFSGPESTAARMGIVLCAHCWLYTSEWGRKHQSDVEGFLHDVEVQLGKPLPRDAQGKLVHCDDADRVLGAISVTSRVFDYHRMMGVLRADDGT